MVQVCAAAELAELLPHGRHRVTHTQHHIIILIPLRKQLSHNLVGKMNQQTLSSSYTIIITIMPAENQQHMMKGYLTCVRKFI